jgi:hypothetical protein
MDLTDIKKVVRLTIITENQNKSEKADKIANLILKELNIDTVFQIDKYSKFENSYKIELEFQFDNNFDSIVESIEKTDRICTPWTIYFDRQKNEIELIFNKTDQSKYRKVDYNVIKWANWTIEK